MDFAFSEKSLRIQDALRAFIATHVAPREADYAQLEEAGVFPPPFLEELKAKARAEGLWNLFLPGLKPDEPGTQMSNLDYAPCAEIMGRHDWASEVFNCSAPDTGNMELLHLAATPAQQERWLKPLLDGAIRSSFAMTEPDVASSDATNIRTAITRDGGDWVINGRKWFITNAADPRTRLFIVMGQTSPDRPEPHRRQSMVLVPADTPGLSVVRNPPVMHQVHLNGHCEVLFENARVPAENLLGEEGGGFALAQARLGPGRIHHCMRAIGAAERALELMIARSLERRTFGQALHEHGTIREWIALSRIELEQARLLVFKTAWLIDQFGTKAARREVSLIKVIVPRIEVAIANRAMQVFGAKGLTQDTPLPDIWTHGRYLQIVDGPDEVHLRSIARAEVRAMEKKLGKTR
ncbi:MAG TPA: acyl-CoA dehydrogenase family protein [Stellaceae bacterium]|jgi:acyl-CoA dehydrogenase|nr:acyl-CoA dehydrogenase family protein [Stellaceae bacterium]